MSFIYGEAEKAKSINKYKRKINGVDADVYDVLIAFGVTNPAIAHAVKKQYIERSHFVKGVI